MMIKKLSKHGNSLALVIDKPILELLGIDENSELAISVQDQGLVLKKAEQDNLPPDFRARADRINQQWAPVFKKLAE